MINMIHGSGCSREMYGVHGRIKNPSCFDVCVLFSIRFVVQLPWSNPFLPRWAAVGPSSLIRKRSHPCASTPAFVPSRVCPLRCMYVHPNSTIKTQHLSTNLHGLPPWHTRAFQNRNRRAFASCTTHCSPSCRFIPVMALQAMISHLCVLMASSCRPCAPVTFFVSESSAWQQAGRNYDLPRAPRPRSWLRARRSCS